MQIKVEDVSTIEKRLLIEVDPSTVDQELTKAYAQLAREVKIPGFRPGKIPRRLLEQRYKDAVEKDVARRLETMAAYNAIAQENIAAVSEPELHSDKLTLGGPHKFSARVEVKPQVLAKDYKGLKLPKADLSVSAEKVEEQLQRMRENASTYEKAERSTAKMGDRVRIDFAATLDGKAFPGSEGKSVLVDVAAGELIEGNIPGLDGAALGTAVVVPYTFPADYRVDEVKGKTAQFSITPTEILEKKTPPLDDAFAKTAASVDTVEALRTKLREDMEKANRQRAEVDERDAIFKALIDKNAFEVPSSMIARATDSMLQNFAMSLYRAGIDPRKMGGFDASALMQDMKPKAEVEVRGYLILESIEKQEGLSVSAEDLEKKLESLCAETGESLSELRRKYKDGDGKRNLESRILEEKTLELIKRSAVYEK